ncbi:hypothetical protein [Pedobacter mucosus]|uniref:hypothetical protein n=1 Tax=Pedobacter mucosus TaxID=2895286 RepID=UPI001EE43A1F|nr:hypothetical protein [Pedobacter mucosus]UKT64587.1 hypothetical protein LOK61_02135 [Pedobacter mucosus]
MNGNIIIDTNIIIYLSKKILPPEKIFFDDTLYSISIITKMELLGYSFSSQLEEDNLKKIISSFNLVSINNKIVDATIQLRKNNKIKLPDAII